MSGAARPVNGAGATRVAAIDCGTNSVRLLVADVDPAAGRLSDVDRRLEIVRLGKGVDATGRITADALARTLHVLCSYRQIIEEASASAVRMVATSATRDAANAGEFVAGVRDILAIEPEVLSGEEEARLSFTGATAELAGDAAGPYLVTDIGGGSTEFVLGDPGTGPVAPPEGPEAPATGSPGAGQRRPVLRSTGPRGTGLRGVSPRSAGLRSGSPRGNVPRGGGLRSADSPGAAPKGAGPSNAPPRGANPLRGGPASTGRTGPLGVGGDQLGSAAPAPVGERRRVVGASSVAHRRSSATRAAPTASSRRAKA